MKIGTNDLFPHNRDIFNCMICAKRDNCNTFVQDVFCLVHYTYTYTYTYTYIKNISNETRHFKFSTYNDSG